MSFGLTNAQATFVDIINRVFWCFLDSYVIIFIDDILVYSKNKGEHTNHLKVVFQVIKEHQLFDK